MTTELLDREPHPAELVVQIAEGGTACLLSFTRSDGEKFVCALNAVQVSELVSGLTTARVMMTPAIPDIYQADLTGGGLPGLAIEVPATQTYTGRQIYYYVRHPGQGWVWNTLGPDHAEELAAALLTQAVAARRFG